MVKKPHVLYEEGRVMKMKQSVSSGMAQNRTYITLLAGVLLCMAAGLLLLPNRSSNAHIDGTVLAISEESVTIQIDPKRTDVDVPIDEEVTIVLDEISGEVSPVRVGQKVRAQCAADLSAWFGLYPAPDED